MLQHAAVAVAVFGIVQAASLPEEWGPACSFGSDLSKCVKEAATKAIQSMMKDGYPSFGISPLDPIRVDKLVVEEGTGSVSINLTLLDNEVLGLDRIHIQEFETNWQELLMKFNIPKHTWKGRYETNGKLFDIPISGTGSYEIDYYNFNAELKAIYSTSINASDGKLYYRMDDVLFNFEPSSAHLQFNNLFNGDKNLGEEMNELLNENWMVIVNEMKPAMSAKYADLIKGIGNQIFMKLSVDDISPP